MELLFRGKKGETGGSSPAWPGRNCSSSWPDQGRTGRTRAKAEGKGGQLWVGIGCREESRVGEAKNEGQAQAWGSRLQVSLSFCHLPYTCPVLPPQPIDPRDKARGKTLLALGWYSNPK